MKHKLTIIIMALAGIVVALATQANATSITFNFQENGPGDLGTTSTFHEGLFALTASAFLNTGDTTDLFAKQGGGDETGLGTIAKPGSGQTSDPNNEINTTNFVQLTLPTTPPSNFQMLLLGSVQSGESAIVYFNANPDKPLSDSGSIVIGTLTSDGSLSIPSQFQTGFIDITAGAKNVLLDSATITIPDGGSALALLGIALAAIEGLRRTLRTK